MLLRLHAIGRPGAAIGGIEALLPFLFEDASPAVVSVAALESAAQIPLNDGDALTGPRLVLAAAARCAGWRRGAILHGFLLLGDEPTVRLIYGCWRELERPNERGVGTLARTLAAFGSQAAGMVNLSRTFPCWAAAGGEAVEILQSWTFPEYAEIAASTLEAIAARESSPRLVPEILRTWRSHRVH